jgi:hypothetical protein
VRRFLPFLILLCAIPAHTQTVRQAAGCTATGTNTCTINASSVNPLSTTLANSLLVVISYQNDSSADTLSISDGSNSYTQTGSYCAASTSDAEAMFYVAGSASVSSITLTWSAFASQIQGIVYEVTGAATASPVDATTACSTAAASGLSLTSGSITTTNPHDILLYGVSLANVPNTWTPGTGFAFATGGTIARMAMQYEVVSSTQSGLTTSMSWDFSIANSQGLFTAFKASGGGGGCTAPPTLTLLGVSQCKG